MILSLAKVLFKGQVFIWLSFPKALLQACNRNGDLDGVKTDMQEPIPAKVILGITVLRLATSMYRLSSPFFKGAIDVSDALLKIFPKSFLMEKSFCNQIWRSTACQNVLDMGLVLVTKVILGWVILWKICHRGSNYCLIVQVGKERTWLFWNKVWKLVFKAM